MSFLINPYIYADAPVCISPLISTSDLQVYYKFDGNSFDSSGSGNTGSATDITYSSGKFDDAAVFNGTSAFVRMPSKDYSASTSFTLTAWIKTTGTTEQHIITRDKVNMSPSSNNRRCWQFRIDASTGVLRAVRFQNNTTVLSNFASTASVNDGNWHHVAMVFDNAVGTKIYIDGSVDGSDALTTNNNNVSDSQPVVGAIQGGTGGVEISFFNGMIDEGVFYNRALTSSEISTLAVGTCPLADAPATPPVTTNLSSWYVGTEGVILNSGFVETWEDQWGSNDFTQGTPANRPAHSTDKLVFDGTNDVMNQLSAGTIGAVFLVMAPVAGGSYPAYIGTQNKHIWIRFDTTSDLYSSAVSLYGNGAPNNFRRNGTVLTLASLNRWTPFGTDKAQFTTSNATPVASQTVRLGHDGAGGAYSKLEIYEMLIYSAQPSTTDRDAIETWLMNKYGL